MISIENGIRDVIKGEHYMDEGCICVICNVKREVLRKKVLSKIDIKDEKVVHNNKKKECKVLNIGIKWL